MVRLHSSPPQIPNGILPSPNSPPTHGKSAEFYVGRSYFPLPPQVVILLEGCSLSEIISWDISVSTKSVKLKITWSCQNQLDQSPINQDLLPSHILKAISPYDLGRPSWSSSSSKNKLALNINWLLNSCGLPNSSVSSPMNGNSLQHSNYPFKSSKSAYFKQNSDSGYQSGGCYGPESNNWRQNVSPPSKPKFSPPVRSNSKNDVYSPSTKAPSSLEKLVLPELTIEKKNQEVSLYMPNSPSQPVNDSLTDSNPISSSSNDANGEGTYNMSNQLCSNISSESTMVPTNDDHSPNPISTNSKLIIDDDKVESSSDEDIPVPPPGFPKSFYPTPNPLPIMKDGFLNPKTKAVYMNISGNCRMCNKKISSYLVDLHLLQCSGIDRQSVEDFVNTVMKKTHLKRKMVVEASKLFCKFELSEKTLPNKFFKKSKDYVFFTKKLETLFQELACIAFRKLNIPETYCNFNLLKYAE